MRSILVTHKNWKSEMFISLPVTSTPLIYKKLQGQKEKKENWKSLKKIIKC